MYTVYPIYCIQYPLISVSNQRSAGTVYSISYILYTVPTDQSRIRDRSVLYTVYPIILYTVPTDLSRIRDRSVLYTVYPIILYTVSTDLSRIRDLSVLHTVYPIILYTVPTSLSRIRDLSACIETNQMVTQPIDSIPIAIESPPIALSPVPDPHSIFAIEYID